MKYLRMLKHVKGFLHVGAIVASSVIAALTASGFGGDPMLGAAIGAVSNGAVAFLGEA